MMFTITKFRSICSNRIHINTSGHFSTSPVTCESALASLRKKTGFALNLCKKALAENENDLAKAESWLREEARRKGWAKATQFQNRRAAEGLIGVYVNSQSKSAVLLEVNCESDFVARNDSFRKLVSDLTLKIASASIVKGSNVSQANGQLLKKYTVAGEDFKPFEEDIASAITHLGESIKLKRATLIENSSNEGQNAIKLTGYAHAVGGLSNLLNGVSLGKYATLLAFREVEPMAPAKVDSAKSCSDETQNKETADLDPDAFDELEQDCSGIMDGTTRDEVAKLLCQHIIGVKPVTLSRPEQDIAKKESSTESKGEEEQVEDALLEQRFLINESVTVKELCTEKGLHIVDFERYECGQEA
ncbi:Elongation factor Ts, mitochondrial [Halotydeus destructor]|nr:Elongation factor Ts, mitochondrial [Halotydeus destructor]